MGTAPDYPTEFSELASGTHGRERRKERQIQTIDLKRARRYGMKEPAKFGRIKYTYGGIVFIYDPIQNREVTSFLSPDPSLSTSGTKCAEPIMLDKKDDHEGKHIVRLHELTRQRAMLDFKSWKSHSVLVVDMSGSMRRDDVNGARCRSDGVFMALARDYVKKQLDEKTATSHDLVTLIIMKEAATVALSMEPMDWVLYNKLVDMRDWTQLRPSGSGNYMPALELAEHVLSLNNSTSCSLSLLFFSDGKPSDTGNFAEKMGQIAAKYGRRLTVCCLGMAEDDENFSTLHDMVTEADAFGALSSFNKPSMHADSLSNIITSMVTTLTGSKTEMTDVVTKQSKAVRTDVRRERKGTPDDEGLTSQWIAYRNSDTEHFVQRVWTWSYKKDEFLYLQDPRCIFCFKTAPSHSIAPRGIQCPNCKACNICTSCYSAGCFHNKHYKTKECYTWLNDIRTGRLVEKDITSFAVAMKIPIFDEGAERMVHKFRFLDDNDRFVGQKMVAKQSRFVELEGEASYEHSMEYHREFLRTQALASQFADLFNKEIDGLVRHFEPEWYTWISKMPRIKFLDPLVVEVVNDDGKELNILIEPQLEGSYVKFNNNMGYVRGRKKAEHDMADLIGSFNHLDLDGGVGEGLGAIEEGSDEEESDEEEEVFDSKQSRPDHGHYGAVHPKHFPQAFSHYTYEKSKKKLMVVDLQGVFEERSDGTCQYMLTDPVIHKRKGKGYTRSKQMKAWTFGRTDRGESGMKAFFQTHRCNEVCRLLGLHSGDTHD